MSYQSVGDEGTLHEEIRAFSAFVREILVNLNTWLFPRMTYKRLNFVPIGQ